MLKSLRLKSSNTKPLLKYLHLVMITKTGLKNKSIYAIKVCLKMFSLGRQRVPLVLSHCHFQPIYICDTPTDRQNHSPQGTPVATPGWDSGWQPLLPCLSSVLVSPHILLVLLQPGHRSPCVQLSSFP